MSQRPIYVIGHKNPDSDAIISAIGYAAFKQAMGINAIAGKIGPVNSECEYLLDRFGFEEPPTLFSGKSTIKEITIDKPKIQSSKITIAEAMDIIVRKNNMGIVIADKHKHLEGIVGTDDLSKHLIKDEASLTSVMADVKLADLVKTLKGELLLEQKNFKSDGHVIFFPGFDTPIPQGAIVITANNPEIQRHCLLQKIAVLIIVGENWIDKVTLQKAKEQHTAVIHSPLSPLNVSRLIYQAVSVGNVMVPKDKIITFNMSDTLDDVAYKMSQSRYRSYPVLDDKGQVVGSISRYHVLNYQKKQFILVDHNELKQTINDIEDAEIIEIVDHHRLGGIETVNPIPITTMTVGATCTIVANKFWENDLKIDPKLAGLLLGGIISDTMNFKSPTTTPIDIKTANELSKISKTAIDELHEGIVNAGGSIINKQTMDVIYGDFKEFNIAKYKVGISQTACKSADEFKAIKKRVSEYIEKECKLQNYDLMIVLFTNPNGSGSHLLFAGRKKSQVVEGFKELLNEDYAANIISRKKQVLPKVIAILNK